MLLDTKYRDTFITILIFLNIDTHVFGIDTRKISSKMFSLFNTTSPLCSIVFLEITIKSHTHMYNDGNI